MQATFLWYDLETTGRDPKTDRIMQFAAVRTDSDLRIVSEPKVHYAQLAQDILPDPESCLITRLTPAALLKLGSTEAQLVACMMQEFMVANTCSAGFNSLRFDEEFVRYTLFRNFYEPYEREWYSGNSRWDILDVLRLASAARPAGINWPTDNAVPTYKLTALAAANHITHAQAHDASSDVLATIALAKLLLQQQPKLFNYCLLLRNKKFVYNFLTQHHLYPIVHTSGMIAAKYYATTVVVPVYFVATKNLYITVDLRYDPQILLEYDADELRAFLFATNSEHKVPLKGIGINKNPVVADLRVLTPDSLARIDLNLDSCLLRADWLKNNYIVIVDKIKSIYEQELYPEPVDIEHSLYSNFYNKNDKTLLPAIRQAPAQKLMSYTTRLTDKRLIEILPRYLARNYYHSLSATQRTAWRNFCYDKLCDVKNSYSSMQFTAYFAKIHALLNTSTVQEQAILLDLLHYGEELHKWCMTDRNLDIR